MPKLLNIAFDLDGVFIDVGEVIKDLILKDGHKYIENDEYQYETNPPMPDGYFWKIVKKAYKLYNKTPLFPYSRRIIKTLYALSADPITIITARPHWSANDTYKQMDLLFGDTPYILIMTGSSSDKLKYLNRFEYFVEDRRKTAIEVASIGKLAIMPRRHYNVLPDDLDPYVKNLILQIDSIESIYNILLRNPDLFISTRR